MRLKALEMQGFKSFPDKIRLTFEDGITAVVGPNGSGKSNISDAVRWVLGEQSNKTLRSKKSEDVIFAGTGSRKPHSFCEVSLIIDNDDKKTGIDSDEIVVTRKYYRSGESEYKINGANVRLKDIHELFMDTGLGRDGYSLIGQGKIAEIVGAKSSERREIFEEASGISKYRYRKEEASRKLLLAEDNLLRLKDILSELEGRVGPLKEQSEKAKKFLEYATEKKALEISLWVNQLEKVNLELRSHENKMLLTKAQYEEAQKELEGIDKAIEEIFSESQRLSAEIENERNEIEEIKEETAKTDSVVAVIRNDADHAKNTLEALENETLLDDELQKNALARKEEAQKGKDALLLKLSELEGLQKADEEKLEEINNEAEKGRQGKEDISKTLSDLSLKISDSNVAILTSKAAIENLSARLSEAEGLKKSREEANALLLEEYENCEELITGLDEKIAEFDNAKEGVMSLYSIRKDKFSRLMERHDGLLKSAEEKLQKAAILEDLEKNMDGMGYSVKAVMGKASSGGLRGIHGPVSKLISVSSEHSLAIETALGGAIQNIVVDNEESAKEAIAYLKRSDSGRATFLPITSVKESVFSEKGVGDLNGFVAMASQLVKTDSKYKSVISSLLGRIVVADDLDSATFIAKKYAYRFKIVTLDGQVINAGGSFTGGSVSKSKGILSRSVQIERLKEEAEALKKEAEGMDGDIEEMREEISSFDAKLLAIESEQKTFSEDKIRYSSEFKRLSISKEEAEEALLRLQKEIDDIIKAKELHNNIINEKTEKIEKDEATKAELLIEQQRMSDADAESVSSREEITARIVERRLEILALTKDIEAFDKAISDIEEERRQKDMSLSQKQEQKAELRAFIEAKEKEAEDCFKRKEEREALAEEKKKRIEALISERMENEKKTSDIRNSEKEKSLKREALAGELARLEEKNQSKKDEYDSIIGRLWSEYELTKAAASELAEEIESISAANKRLSELKNKIRALGSVNVDAIEEYKEVSERYEFLFSQVSDAQKSKDELINLINELTKEMSRIFLENFEKINHNFSRIFTELFGGGSARLELSDRENILESGIEIIALPPGKTIKNLSALSGGEQSFIAIAIYFAILSVKPAPFCILDEIEAALDDVNVTRYASYLRRMCKNTQFISITHRRGTMEEADVLYGVTMQEQGVSKLLKLNVNEVASKLGIK